MSEENISEATRASKWLLPKWGWVLLCGSIALNLLVIGSIVGHYFSGHKFGGHGMRGLVQSLPDGEREKVRKILRKHRAEIRPLRRALRESKRELAAYAKTEDMDVAEFERRLLAIHSRRDAIRNRLNPVMMELARMLEGETRGLVLERLLRVGRPGHRRRHRRH